MAAFCNVFGFLLHSPFNRLVYGVTTVTVVWDER